MPEIDTILFDLDGTLVDTGPDMAYALNMLRLEEGHTPLSYSQIRPHVSHGATALTRLGFDIEPDDPNFESLRQRFLHYYQQYLCRNTQLFDGMEQVLQHCEARSIAWGIVTNKPAYLTEPLVTGLGLGQRAACVVSGDTVANRKPHPGPLLHACKIAGALPNQTVYVGDAARDVTAGNDAGMVTLVATFGYLSDDDRPQDWGADGLVATPAAIIPWLNGHA